MDRKQFQKLEDQLNSQTPLIGGRQRRQAAEALARDGSPKAIHLLVQATGDGLKGDVPFNLLTGLALEGHALAREALCALVILRNHAVARQITLANGWLPRKDGTRALFFFLTEQWEQYESLDFDQSLLRAAYAAASEGLRGRIAEKARQAGRVEWVGVVTGATNLTTSLTTDGGRQSHRMAAMTDAEWATTLAVLYEGGRGAEMWRLAQVAPPLWSARLLRRVRQTSWVANEVERSGFEELLQLAGKCDDKVPDQLGRLVKCRATLEGHEGSVECLALSADGRLLTSGSEDETVRLWSLPDGKPLHTLTGRGVNCLVASPDGRLLASGSDDHTVRLWSLPDGKPLHTLTGHTGYVNCLVLSADGCLLASGSGDKTVRLWSLTDGKLLHTLQGHTNHVTRLALSANGKLLASGSDDHTVRLWSLPDGKPIKTLEGHTREVTRLVVSGDGKLLATGSWDNTVRLWSLPEGKPLHTLKGHTASVMCLALSANGQLLVSGGDNTVRLWSLPDGKPIKTLEGHWSSVECLVLGPDGRLLVSGGDETVRLWSLPGGNLIKTLEGHTWVNLLALSADGRLLASGGWDNTVRLWDMTPCVLPRLPVAQITLQDLEWAQEALRGESLAEEERVWLEFMEALMRWRRRYDIHIEDASTRIDLGTFDIEIEG